MKKGNSEFENSDTLATSLREVKANKNHSVVQPEDFVESKVNKCTTVEDRERMRKKLNKYR